MATASAGAPVCSWAAPLRNAPLARQTRDQPLSAAPWAASLAATAPKSPAGRRATTSPGSSSTWCSQPRHTLAWNPSCVSSPSSSMAASSGGTALDRPDGAGADVAEAAVEGRWALCSAICASSRAVRVRPGRAVSHALRLWGRPGRLTLAVRCVLLNLAAQLGHVFPACCASGLVELVDVALGLFALRGVLCRCKLPERRRS